ncbi:uncharacterized protein LOC130986218 [Salvia miltiorrhiza]|uniref:uncharacterized protein LOC130986218 n=2 Tax=Salvia miltiorrhiza TaxID=226208 RepID=UPI0025ABB36E|nr:uncharacterized protein LOC130986218 [Salvia miltiorrhiza]
MASSSNEMGYRRPETINRPGTQISSYYKTSYLSLVPEQLREIGGDALETTFRQGCFGHLLDWDPGNRCNMALHHIVSRSLLDCDDVMWFYINGRKVGLDHAAFALVTGLPFGPHRFDPTATHNLKNCVAYTRVCGGQRLSVQELANIFFERWTEIVDPDGSIALRVAHLLVLHAFVLGVDLPRPVEIWTWALVEDLSEFSTFPWGAAAYNRLNYRMRKMSKEWKYHFYGPSWALYTWGLEVVPGLGRAVAIHNAGILPRFKRWTFRSKIKEDLQPLFESPENGLYELQPEQQEATTHWWLSVANDGDVQFPGPGVFGQRHPRADMSGGDRSEASIQRAPRRRSSRREDRGKRQRPQVVSSSSSSGQRDQSGGDDRPVTSGRRSQSQRRPRYGGESSAAHGPSGLSEQEWQRMEQMVRESEGRVARRVEEGLFTRLKNWAEETFGCMRCRCSHSTDVRQPMPAPRPQSDRRREPEPEAELETETEHEDAPSQQRSPAHESPARDAGHSGSDDYQTPPGPHTGFGVPTTFGAGLQLTPYLGPRYSYTEQPSSSAHPFEPPRSSLPILAEAGYSQEEMERLWQQFSGGASASGATPAIPLSVCPPPPEDAQLRRSYRERQPSAALRSPYVHSNEPKPVDNKYIQGFTRMAERLRGGNYRKLVVTESGHPIKRQFWVTLMNRTKELEPEHVDAYMMTLRHRLVSGTDLLQDIDHRSHIILDAEFFVSINIFCVYNKVLFEIMFFFFADLFG